MLKVKPRPLKQNYEINQICTLNGLQKYSCESYIYTPNNIFYLQSPTFSREDNYEYWDLGFLDVKNILFYELNILTMSCFEKNMFFYEWISFLQLVIDKKIYSKFFELFGFEKGQLQSNDRLAYERSFSDNLKKLVGDNFSVDFLIYLTDLFKVQNKMISYTVMKKKLVSNLKNFKDDYKINFSNGFGLTK